MGIKGIDTTRGGLRTPPELAGVPGRTPVSAGTKVVVPAAGPNPQRQGYPLPINPYGNPQYTAPGHNTNRSPIVKIGMGSTTIRTTGAAGVWNLPLSGKAVLFQGITFDPTLPNTCDPSAAANDPAEVWEISFDDMPASIQLATWDLRNYDSALFGFVPRSQPSLFLNGFPFGKITIRNLYHAGATNISMLRIIAWEEPLGLSSIVYQQQALNARQSTNGITDSFPVDDAGGVVFQPSV